MNRIRMLSLLLVLVLLPVLALGEMTIPAEGNAIRALEAQLSSVNAVIRQNGGMPFNTVFDASGTEVWLGARSQDGGDDVPAEGETELTVTLDENGCKYLVLSSTDMQQFPRQAAALISVMTDGSTYQEALKLAQAYVNRAQKEPERSFGDEVILFNSTSPRYYWVYEYNRYSSGYNYFDLTIVFPLAGYSNTADVTPTPAPLSDGSEEYEGIQVNDGYMHFEVFMTPTPEPDSAAGQTELMKQQQQ